MRPEMGVRGATLFYATILEVYPDDPREEIWPRIVETFQNWVIEKERHYSKAGSGHSSQSGVDIPLLLKWQTGMLTSAHTASLLRSQIGASLEILSGKEGRVRRRQNPESSILKQLSSDREEWHESRPDNSKSAIAQSGVLVSRSFSSTDLNLETPFSSLKVKSTKEEGVPRLWAMEYTEKDGGYWWRTWHTHVGITSSGTGTYHVAIQILFNIDPTYLRADVRAPIRNVPRCARNLLSLEGIACIAGEDPLTKRALFVRGSTESQGYSLEQFYDDLTKPIRTIPLVVISSDDSGRYPAKPDELARKLTGVASVIAIDRSDATLNSQIERIFFTRDSRNYPYRPYRYSVKIYFPGVNMDNPDDCRRHYQFPPEWLSQNPDDLCGRIASDVIASAARSFSCPAGIASSCADVEDIIANERRDELANRYREYRAKERSGERERLKSQYETVLDELAKTKEQERERTSELSHAEELLEESLKAISQKDRDLDELNEYVSLLENDVEDLTYKNGILHRKASDLSQKNEQTQWEVEALKEQLRRQSGEPSAIASCLDDLHSLSSVEEALNLAGRLFPATLVIHPDAQKSARDHDSGDHRETWNILYAIATTLYDLCFEEGLSEGGNLEDRFRQETGFALSLRETKATKNSSALRKVRQIVYEGETVDITPHVKGKSGRSGETLRIHFYLDHHAKRIVIGHCGAHLETAGTRRKGFR